MDVQVWEQDPEIQILILRKHIQKFLMPKLAGCQDAANGNAASAQAGNRRHLQDGDPRNVIANGLVTVRIKEGQDATCDDYRYQPYCYVVAVIFDLSILGSESIILITAQVFQEVGNELKGILELDAPFVGVHVNNVGSLDATSVPSASPSMRPSSFITAVPSNNPTPNPSGAPAL